MTKNNVQKESRVKASNECQAKASTSGPGTCLLWTTVCPGTTHPLGVPQICRGSGACPLWNWPTLRSDRTACSRQHNLVLQTLRPLPPGPGSPPGALHLPRCDAGEGQKHQNLSLKSCPHPAPQTYRLKPTPAHNESHRILTSSKKGFVCF